jgi:aryl-alcohol dehydrogenase-like predicted oxidoreductase
MSFTETFDLAPGYTISRVIRGGWQLAGDHGVVARATVNDDLAAFYDAGITTFDCADIYTGVEAMIGDFRSHMRNRRGVDALARLRVHTKFVPDLAVLPGLIGADVRRIIDRSLQRLGVERPKARSTSSAAPISTRRMSPKSLPPGCALPPCRCNIRCSIGVRRGR